MQPTPINMAEAIFEPFWDPQTSGLAHWQVQPGSDHGLRVFQMWYSAAFEWARKPKSGPALRMSRRFDVDCSGYDHLMISALAPDRSILRMVAETDRGTVALETVYVSEGPREFFVDLQGATAIHTVTLEVEARAEGNANGWFNWLGLQSSALMPRYRAQFTRFDAAWEGYLKPDSYEPTFVPTYGLLLDAAELDALRAEHERHLQEHGSSPFVEAARQAQRLVPEQMIHDYITMRPDDRLGRERDSQHLLLMRGPDAALAGLLLKDKELLRLGARYAMALAMCSNWDDSMMCHFPGSPWETRVFQLSQAVRDTSLILDLAGELFTDLGRDLLLRRIAEEGQGSINFCTWKHEYIHHCNQMPWFSAGRLAGYALLERYWPRVRPYTELAYQELVASIDDTILPDGGYVEGPTYFGVPSAWGGWSLLLYARARGLGFEAVATDALRRAGALGAVLASTDEGADVIPICDAKPAFDPDAAAVMAALAPKSQWVGVWHKALARSGSLPGSLLAWKMAQRIPATAPAPQPFTTLPEMGVMVSQRNLHGEPVKLLLMGGPAGTGHAHEDKGSFVLEYAGDTFAMDPGICSYNHPLMFLLKQCDHHNMLVPTGTRERPRPQNPLPADVKPRGEGDATRFSASIDLTPGWGPYYRRWTRRWASPSPDVLTISDEYELAQGDGVEFLWNTRLPIRIEGQAAVITGKRGRVTVEAPGDCTLVIDDLPLLDGTTQHRLHIRREGSAGRLEVRVRLSGCPRL